MILVNPTCPPRSSCTCRGSSRPQSSSSGMHKPSSSFSVEGPPPHPPGPADFGLVVQCEHGILRPAQRFVRSSAGMASVYGSLVSPADRAHYGGGSRNPVVSASHAATQICCAGCIRPKREFLPLPRSLPAACSLKSTTAAPLCSRSSRLVMPVS